MATFNRLPSGYWRAQVRRKGHAISRSFRIKAHAEEWARDQETLIEKGVKPTGKRPESRETIADLIDLQLADYMELRRPIGRSKELALRRLRETIGATRVGHVSREFLIDFAKRRGKAGAGPVTIGIDVSFIGNVLEHAAAVHGMLVPMEQVRLGRVALSKLGMIAKSNERDRRPTEEELRLIIETAENNPRQLIPLGRIVKFAVATAMRQDEISRVMWDDMNAKESTLIIRQRKHPRAKATNDQKIPLVADTGFDAAALIQEQGDRYRRNTGFIFPYDGRSVGAAFRRVCRDLGIEDLHFHDLRHEAISRLFEADWDIPQVATVSGHKDWKMLQRYTHLRPAFIASRSGRAKLAASKSTEASALP